MVWDKLTDVVHRTTKLESTADRNEDMVNSHEAGIAAANQRMDALLKFVNETADSITAYSDQNARHL